MILSTTAPRFTSTAHLAAQPATQIAGQIGGPRAGSSSSSTSSDLERLGDQIAELATHLHAAQYRLLVLIAEFDRRQGWDVSFRSCAHWLSWRTGIALGAAREKVRVARALEQLPLLSEALSRGELSYSKARALTRVATAATEGELRELARHATATQVERVVRALRWVDRSEAEVEEEERRRHISRSLKLWADEDGRYVLRGRLDAEVGALLQRALAAAEEALYPRGGQAQGQSPPLRELETTAEQRRADALGLLTEWALVGGAGGDRSRSDRYQVVVHVAAEEEPGGAAEPSSEPASEPASEPGRRPGRRPARRLRWGVGMLERGVNVSAETSQRLACDQSRLTMTHTRDGTPLDVGRKRRTVPVALRRALEHRDGGCRFPGCCVGLRFCDAHHLTHWVQGGETRLDNLLLLCRRHHRAVHEMGFRVEWAAQGQSRELRFFRPDGRPLPQVPTPPSLPHDPVAALVRVHQDRGIRIDLDPEREGRTPRSRIRHRCPQATLQPPPGSRRNVMKIRERREHGVCSGQEVEEEQGS